MNRSVPKAAVDLPRLAPQARQLMVQNRGMRWVALTAGLLGAGCSDGDTCDLPTTTHYSCEPIPAGSFGCVGGPTYLSGRDDQWHADDLETTFPVECRAGVPDCSSNFRGSLRTFECSPTGTWSEAL